MHSTQSLPNARRSLGLRMKKAFLLAGGRMALVCAILIPRTAASQDKTLAPTPPMGWNDWAHYECTISARTILDNAEALVRSGLAAAGYNTVTIDDCWMQKDRD